MTNQVRGKALENSPGDAGMGALVEKVKTIAAGPHGEAFARVVDVFLDMTEREYFSPDDLADIQEGLEDIRQGRYLTLEEYRQGKRL